MHTRFQAWGVNHVQALVFSLGRLYRNPFAAALTLTVIAIALALPSGLWLALKNLQAASSGWDHGAQLSVFVDDAVSDGDLQSLAERITGMAAVDSARPVTREDALAEFRALSGFGEALDLLDHNPLPALVLVTPAPDHQGPEQVRSLASELEALEGVTQAQVDLQWVQRLQAILEMTRRGVALVAVLLALGVLLVVGNTIRLDILNRRREIEVAKLVGATNGFIRRPFLYGGLWLGLFGGLLALIIVGVGLVLLNGPVQQLAALYGSDFRLEGPGFRGALGLLGLAVALGLGGSWIAVGRHLRDIEPQ
ncbi:cell division protein FtsX [Thioalkalivibrio denitrificans]|uniref:Cell division protein FtsX n=1 Tax=Thioalkalivibrio denitrificans TaxID=108003 RepID=A0A1V3NDF8_9GAMM|nr:cell division protein FtsX [Thioalkalivibrio denitrificans]